MGERRTNYRLWAVCSGGLFVVLWLLLVGTGFGWFVQSVAALQDDGPRRCRDPQANDYDDRLDPRG